MRYKGEITVFLTLLFGVLSAFCLTVIESARAQAIRAQTERVMLTAIFSCASEYNRDLYDRYDIFGIDCSYRGSASGIASTEAHLLAYAEANFRPLNPALLGADWLRIRPEKMELTGYRFLSCGKGEELACQIRDLAQSGKNLASIPEFGRLQSLMQKTDAAAFMAEYDAAVRATADVADHPARDVYEIALSADLLEMTFGQTAGVQKMPKDRPSVRSLKQGRSMRSATVREKNGLTDQILCEYLVAHFGTCVKPLPQTCFRSEQEYLIFGNPNEGSNLASCAELILNQRMTENYRTMSQEDAVLVQTAEWAKQLCTDGGDVAMMQNALLCGWVYAESVVQVASLLAGGSVNLRGECTHIVPLRSMRDFRSYCGVATSGSEDYQDCLVGMLGGVLQETLRMRCLDLIEQNLKANGHPGFSADGCITAFVARMEIVSDYGYSYSIEREYAYLE